MPEVTTAAIAGTWRRHLSLALEIVILAHAAALILFVLGIHDLGVASVSRGEKPLLILLVAIPLRVTLGGPSWLAARGRRLLRDPAALRAATIDRLPPAIVDPLFALAVIRVGSIFVGFVANVMFPAARMRAIEMPFRQVKFFEIFAAWDSGWYFDIARRGYYWNADGQSSIAFFPLYPLLIRAGAWPFGGTDHALWLSAITISGLAYFLALVALHRFTERWSGDREVARRTVLYLSIFPFALFFTRVYAESIFLLTSVMAVSRAWDGRWWRAGMWGALATLARPNGILIAIPLVLLALRDRPGPLTLTRRSAALALLPAALGGFCAFAYSLSGDPLAWLHAQSQWGYSLGHPPWQLLLSLLGRVLKHGAYDYFFVSPLAPFRLFHGLAALMFLALTPAVFKRLGPALGAYVLVSLLVPLSGNALEGLGRYTAVLFPVFMVLGGLRSQRLHEALLIVAALLRSLFVILFVTLRPIY
jgi:hypothetical protein